MNENKIKMFLTAKTINNDRKGHKKDVKGAFSPTPAAQFEMPNWYGEMFVSIKELVANGRRQVMFTANVQMSMICSAFVKSSQMKKLCNGALHNYHGDTTFA